jgi:outer membrane protein TolC
MGKMTRSRSLIAILLLPNLVLGADTPRLAISLDQAVQASLDTSDQWKSARLNAEGAEDQALSQRGRLLPKLSIDGSYTYLAEIPTLQLSPQAPAVAFTTHNQYSIGPEINWTAFSGGAISQSWRAAQANAHAQRQEAEAIQRQIRLAARLVYFQAQLAAEQVRLYAESYHVEQAQYHDIDVRFRNGESAKVDLLSAEQDLLTRQNQLLQARANLAAAIRDLTSITQQGENLDPTWPQDAQAVFETSAEMPASTLILALDHLSDSLAQMDPKAGHRFDQHQPSLEYLSELAESSRRTAKSLEGGHWPTLNVLASIMREYPNGPIAQSVTQKTFGVNLNFPLFAGGETLYAVRAQKKQAEATEETRVQTARNLLDSWQKAKDQTASLRIQQALTHRAAERAAEVARLRYQAYQLGQLRYLDVEDANLKEVQAKVDAATTNVNLLIQLANLESLSEE